MLTKIPILPVLVSLIVILGILSGCASRTQGYGPHFTGAEEHIRTMVILRPDLYAYEVSGGGIPEFRIDWSRSAEQNLSKALEKKLNSRKFECSTVLDSAAFTRWDSTISFVRFISAAIAQNLYGENVFVPQIESFDYSTGSLAELCDFYHADAAVFLFGADEHYSELRKEALNRSAAVKTAQSAVLSSISLLLTGSASFRSYTIMPERTFLCCIIADRSGKIIWYKRYFEADGFDLGKQSDAETVAEQIVTGA